MARNVEIKARVADMRELVAHVEAIATSGPTLIVQHDTFFRCSTGRLKLREFADGSAELIHYQREDHTEPKASQYLRTPVTDPDGLKLSLSFAYGQQGCVNKQRALYQIGRTRVHLDRVEGLGDFLELEVVLDDAEPVEVGLREAHRLMAVLGVSTASLEQGAYRDLLDASPQG